MIQIIGQVTLRKPLGHGPEGLTKIARVGAERRPWFSTTPGVAPEERAKVFERVPNASILFLPIGPFRFQHKIQKAIH